MLDFAERRAKPDLEVPADIEMALARPDWRQRVLWPVSLAEANRIVASQAARAIDWAARLDDELVRDGALLALPTILGYGRAILLAAFATKRAAAGGMRFIGSAPELAYLASGEGAPPARAGLILPPGRVRGSFARRVARIQSWSGFGGLPRALLRPDAVVVSHNALLRTAAARQRRSIGFRYAETMLAAARVHRHARRAVDDYLGMLAETLLGDAVQDEPYRARALALLQAVAKPHLDKAVGDMAGLRSITLPDEIWSGSGGLYAPRALGLEVLRRGGKVVRFDHGTPRGFVRSGEFTALLELAVSSEFVLSTEGAAEICLDDPAARLPPGRQTARVRGASGDPTFAAIPMSRKDREKRARPRVVYAPTQLLGFRQLLPAQAPDVVYLDWQLRVAEALRGLPISLICQPHPEGLLAHRSHPLEEVATTIRGNFDVQLREADVFVFDYPSTTALWQAACTDARIVFLDMGAGTFSPRIAKLIAERAHIIKVEHDEQNRPILDAASLRDAVLASRGPVDPMPFRRLLAGDA